MNELSKYQKAVGRIILQREKEIIHRNNRDVGLDTFLTLIQQQGMSVNDCSKVQWINTLDPFVKEIVLNHVDITCAGDETNIPYVFITLQCLDNLFKNKRAGKFWRDLYDTYPNHADMFLSQLLRSIDFLYTDFLNSSSSVINPITQAASVLETIELLLAHTESLPSIIDLDPNAKNHPFNIRPPAFVYENGGISKSDHDRFISALTDYQKKLSTFTESTKFDLSWRRLRFGHVRRIDVAAFWARFFSYLTRQYLRPTRPDNGKRTSYNKLVAEMLNLLYNRSSFSDNYVADKIRGMIDHNDPKRPSIKGF